MVDQRHSWLLWVYDTQWDICVTDHNWYSQVCVYAHTYQGWASLLVHYVQTFSKGWVCTAKEEAKKAATNYETGNAQWCSETGRVCIYVHAYRSSSSMLCIMLSLQKKGTEKPGRLLQDNNTFTSYGTIFTLSGVKYLDIKCVQFQFHPNRIRSASWKWNTRCHLLSVFRQECLQCHLTGMTWRIGFAVLGNRMLEKL